MHQQELQQEITAPDLCVSAATDADEHERNLRDWEQQYDQLSDGAFYGRIDELALDHLQVFREHTSQSLRQQCNVWPDSVWLGFAATDQHCRINGQAVSPSQLMCRPGNTEFELVTPEHFDIYGIVASQRALAHTAEVLGMQLDSRLWSAPRRGWGEQKLSELRYLLQRLLAPQYRGRGGPLQQDMLLVAVLDILQQPQSTRDIPPSYARRKAVVERVKEFLEANPHSPVTITELCELTHVSRRTLQYSFESILGINPLRYLRVSRLNAVRRVLSQPLIGGDETTVNRIATHWGFWHAGQFAHDYKQLFGENPSATLHRARHSTDR